MTKAVKGRKSAKSVKKAYSAPIRSALNPLVEAKVSNIPQAGLGLFALKFLEKGSIVATYGGYLVEYQEAKYMNPEYSVDFEHGKGAKLIGDAKLDDLGIYANAIHPLNKDVVQNARFHVSSKVYLPDRRGRFNIMAKRDILPGEEIIVDYGKFYWKACQDFQFNPPVKPEAAVARDARALKRREVAESLRMGAIVVK